MTISQEVLTNKRILTLCLALALCLSLIPAAVFADEALFDYTVIRTGIEASSVSMMGNGLGSYKQYDENYSIVSKGVVYPNGILLLSRNPSSDDPGGESTGYFGTGTGFADLQPVNRSSGSRSWNDIRIYQVDMSETQYVLNIVREHDGISTDAWLSIDQAFYGNDGYLTVHVMNDRNQTIAYIIDIQTREVMLEKMLDIGSPRMGGDSWWLTSVNEGLIAYNHSEYREEDDYMQHFLAAGWMDINGEHRVSIDTERYGDWWHFSSGRAQVWDRTKDKYGYVDKNGKLAIPCTYDDASMFKNGYAYVGNYTDGKYRYGYIDTAGRTVIPFEYDSAYGYGEGLFAVGMKDSADVYKYGLVDEYNNVVVPLIYDDMSYVRDDTAYAIEDGELVVLQFNYFGPVVHYTMEKENGKTSGFDVDPARRTVKVQGSQSESEPVLIASYDENGRFLGVKAVTEDEGKVSFDRDSETLLLLATDSKLQPMAEAIEVDLTAPVEQTPTDDVAAK